MNQEKEYLFVATPSYTQTCTEQARQRCCLNFASFGRAFPNVEFGFNNNECSNIPLAYQAMYERAKDKGADWFMSFEADMMPERGGNTFTTLWAALKRRNLDHIAALYYLNNPEEPWPLIYTEADAEMVGAGDAKPDHPAYINHRAYPENRMIQVDATGLGITIIRMDALRRVEEESPYWRKAGDSIFQITSPFSVDMAISFQLRRLGYQLWVHSGVIVDHVSRQPLIINERMYQKRFGEVYWPDDDPYWDKRDGQIAKFRRWVKRQIMGFPRPGKVQADAS